MTRRKGEITERQIRRDWPHQVALPEEAVRGVSNSMAVYSFAKELSGAPRPYHLRRGDREFAVFCFREPHHAEAFHARFDGERLPVAGDAGRGRPRRQ